MPSMSSLLLDFFIFSGLIHCFILPKTTEGSSLCDVANHAHKSLSRLCQQCHLLESREATLCGCSSGLGHFCFIQALKSDGPSLVKPRAWGQCVGDLWVGRVSLEWRLQQLQVHPSQPIRNPVA